MEPRNGSGEIFEQLLLLRHCYPLRSDYDRTSSLTIAEAVRMGERLLHLVGVHNRWQGHDSVHRAA